MIRKTLFVLTAITLLLVINVNAQNCSQCDIALLSGARDEFESKNHSNYNEATNELFKENYKHWMNYEQSGNKTLKANAAYKVFESSFKSSSVNSQSEQKFEDFKKDYEKNHSLSQEAQIYISSKTASETAYKAWTTCILGCDIKRHSVRKRR
ncbi:MAG: hypothetical protein ACK4YV_09050 [Emticicia sp.]